MSRPVAVIAATAALAALLCGCSAFAAGRDPTPTALAPLTPTPTVSVGFQVAVTPQRVVRHRRPTPRPRATRFVPPPGPYLTLIPSSGPPVSRTITVRGGNLSPLATIQLLWLPKGARGGISITAYTDKRGALSTRFTLPGSAPGTYLVRALLDGVPMASAPYRIYSRATIQVTASPSPGGETVKVIGRHFLTRLKLALIAYPMSRGGNPLVLGSTRSNKYGAFTFVRTTRRLVPGQYVLRAWSSDAMSAQMAQGFFGVVI